MTPQEHDARKRLVDYDGPDRVEKAKVILEIERQKPKPPSYSTGLPMLDIWLGGGAYPGQLFTIGGPPGHGKTTLGQTISKNFIHKQVFPLWFSFEVTTTDFLAQFHEAYLEDLHMPLENAQGNLKWIEERIIESCLKYNTKAVFIDHLHRVADMTRGGNISERVGVAVVKLKEMAVRHGMMMFLMCHVTKVNNIDRELGLGDCRDSGLIEAESDTVVYVWRDPEDDMRTVLKIAKNRKAGLINKRLALRLEEGTYYEESHRSEDERAYKPVDSRDRRGMDKGTSYGSSHRKGYRFNS